MITTLNRSGRVSCDWVVEKTGLTWAPPSELFRDNLYHYGGSKSELKSKTSLCYGSSRGIIQVTNLARRGAKPSLEIWNEFGLPSRNRANQMYEKADGTLVGAVDRWDDPTFLVTEGAVRWQGHSRWRSKYRRRSGETSYLHFVKTATIPMVPYVTTLNFHDISNVHVQVRNWRYEISPLRRRYT
ncbi:unnamed protein product [Nesidiocoris tenuis]|uniref:Uncharacterized protein n=1 Tax=Nesidiocoris tenuis TaxID=355587 RepID=A0A6H5G307_9HEMI|nr:unnamed protein product [Nesidiocoris tenuis]CAA9996436.1 unnamed protein product [Nesidiocoris tenuis]